jgi:hypothetical protein
VVRPDTLTPVMASRANGEIGTIHRVRIRNTGLVKRLRSTLSQTGSQIDRSAT